VSEYHQFVQRNAEKRWERETQRIDAAIERYAAEPAKLDDSPFSILYTATLAWGPSRIAPVAARVEPLLPPAMAARTTKVPKSAVELGVANLANLLACCGHRDLTAPISEWLSEIQTSKDEEPFDWHWDRGFASLALDRKKLYRALAGVGPDDPLKVEPGKKFGGNLQGLLRHLAAAVEQRAGFAAIEPAWRDLVANLRRHEQSGQIGRATPFWIARIVHHRIGGAPLGEVAGWLHEQIAA
jgi:hypothetical protein